MKALLTSLFVWLFFLAGVAAHTWWQARRSKNSTNPNTPDTIREYLERYAPIIVVRVLFGVVIFGIWLRNPNMLVSVSAALAAKAHGVGWDTASTVIQNIVISPNDIYTALGFGLSLDSLLYVAARYVPGFKSVLPDAPTGGTMVMSPEDVKKLTGEDSK